MGNCTYKREVFCWFLNYFSYVNLRYNLVEFIQHFNRCVDHIWWKEVQADLASVNGRPSMQTCFQQLEKSAANVYTLSIFYMFQPILVRVASMKVINMRQTFLSKITRDLSLHGKWL
ncbi:hypothetical protein Ahy_A10g048508 [Arachis hypogaea]|uniref:Uncharacterized protein n=1 Tax=Arachis hypogaea TaxID=3818 RepID=A0A445B597_ARAHY|nr:hypothetical protein Ahy_A10g048508 [Arachis hypogaea]